MSLAPPIVTWSGMSGRDGEIQEYRFYLPGELANILCQALRDYVATCEKRAASYKGPKKPKNVDLAERRKRQLRKEAEAAQELQGMVDDAHWRFLGADRRADMLRALARNPLIKHSGALPPGAEETWKPEPEPPPPRPEDFETRDGVTGCTRAGLRLLQGGKADQ